MKNILFAVAICALLTSCTNTTQCDYAIKVWHVHNNTTDTVNTKGSKGGLWIYSDEGTSDLCDRSAFNKIAVDVNKYQILKKTCDLDGVAYVDSNGAIRMR